MPPRIWRPLTVAVLGAAVACESRDVGMADSAEPAATAAPASAVTNVRVVNAVPGAASVDLIADDQPEVTAVAFRSVSPYEQVSNEVRMFRVIQSGHADTATLARSNELALTGQYHTLIVLGTPPDDRERATARDTASDTARGDTAGGVDAGVRLAHLRDDEPISDSTRARLRVVHAASNADELDIVIAGTGEPVLTGIGYGVTVHTAEVPAGTATIQIRREGQTSALTRVQNVSLEAGRTTTIVVTHPSPGSSRLEVIQVPEGGATGTTAPRDTSR
jgi:hypothetical protein